MTYDDIVAIKSILDILGFEIREQKSKRRYSAYQIIVKTDKPATVNRQVGYVCAPWRHIDLNSVLRTNGGSAYGDSYDDIFEILQNAMVFITFDAHGRQIEIHNPCVDCRTIDEMLVKIDLS